MNICCLQSNMTRESAQQKLAPTGPQNAFRRWLNGNLRGLAEVYLPYRLYRIVIDDQRLQCTRYYAIDAAVGTLDPYQFAALPSAEDFAARETRNCHPVLLDERQTQELAIEQVRRSLFSTGFFRLSNPSITASVAQPSFYIPYWTAFYGHEQDLKIQVLNAVRQTREGSKVRNAIARWLLS